MRLSASGVSVISQVSRDGSAMVLVWRGRHSDFLRRSVRHTPLSSLTLKFNRRQWRGMTPLRDICVF